MTRMSPDAYRDLAYRFGKNLARCRRRAGFSQEELSFMASLHRTEIGMLERGSVRLACSRELGLRSADLARLTGTTEATISRWVHGRSRPVPKNLERLAKALKTPYAQVVEVAGRAA